MIPLSSPKAQRLVCVVCVCVAVVCLGTVEEAGWRSLSTRLWTTSTRQGAIKELQLKISEEAANLKNRSSTGTAAGKVPNSTTSTWQGAIKELELSPPGTAAEKVPTSKVCNGSKALEFAAKPSCSQQDRHTFDNGVSICKNAALTGQLERYRQENLHEPDESKIFYSLVKRAPHGATLLDIGAAIGYYALWAVKIEPSLVVYGFNPAHVFQRQFAEHQLLNFGMDHLDQICQDQHCVDERDGRSIYIGIGFGAMIGANPGGQGNNCITITWSSWIQKQGLEERPYLVMVDIQGIESTFVPLMLSHELMPDLLIIGTHSTQIHGKLLKEVELKGYSILSSAGYKQQKLAPDGSIVAVRANWSRREEFQALAQHFTKNNLDLAFAQYVAADASW